VEVLATARAKLSFDANPIDVHRAVDAALVGIDRLARNHPKALIVATTNFETAVDEAFLSRADVVMTIPAPDQQGREIILRDTLEAIGELDHLLDGSTVARLAAAGDGIDARQLRKAVAAALARRQEVARDFSKLTEADVIAAISESLRR
jgi:SpoVK/Ycf46/Vps4 family AAA+-type ATPase